MANPMVPPMDPRQMAQQGMVNPFMPPQEPPPSPSLGFQTWASDPRNAHLVMPSMTAPDAPLQPNAPSAAANPPAPPAMAAVRPPQVPGVAQAQQQLGNDQAELSRLQQTGPGVNQIHNKGLRVLAKIGDVAGSIVAPGIAAAVPGTTNHNRLLQMQAGKRVQNDQNSIAALNQSAQDAANLTKTQQEIQMAPQRLQLEQTKASGTLAQHGLKMDDNGNIVPDETSPAYQEQQGKIELAQAQIEAQRANVELRNATADLKRVQANPDSPQFKLAQQRVAVAQQNAAAAQQRAQAYMGRYMQSAFNTDLKGNVLPGATQISDENGDQTVVGTGNASQAVKANSNAAQFGDVHGALDHLEQSARNLVQNGGSLNSPRVAAALAQPHGTLGQWLQGEGVKAGLTPQEREYVTSIVQARENIQAMRKSAGGTATDSSVDRLEQMLPNASTPDLDYFLKQTGQIRSTAERLGKGVSTARGGLNVRGQHPAAAPTQGGTIYARDPQGKLHQAPKGTALPQGWKLESR